MARVTYEVHLAIYDLSHGMARSLSGQFLGPDHALDIIPHTGVVVYGKEYFFGGGIQSANPTEFRRSSGMFPIQTEVLGRTTVTEQEFNQWCRECMRTGRYSMESYSLIDRNCNNFSHDAVIEGLKLPNGVPEWILDVPRRFLASPMGQMVRPMLEQMQVHGGGSAAPFANAAPTVAAPTAPDPTVNPWANLPSAASSTTTNVASNSQADLTTPVLDSHKRPLLSSDAKTATLCANKLIANAQEESDKEVIKEIAEKLSGGAEPSEELVEASSGAILKLMNADDKSSLTFALMLLRLVMLHPPKDISETSSFYQCLEWVQQQLSQNGSSSLQTAAARSMAWCTLSNAYGSSCKSVSSLDSAVESAMGDMLMDSQPRVEVRQAAAAFLYNVGLVEAPRSASAEELPDLLVSLLCACLDGIASEPDATTQLRRLLVAERIVKPTDSVHAVAKNLVSDLGFVDALHALAAVSEEPNASGDKAKVQKLTAEFIRIMES